MRGIRSNSMVEMGIRRKGILLECDTNKKKKNNQNEERIEYVLVGIVAISCGITGYNISSRCKEISDLLPFRSFIYFGY